MHRFPAGLFLHKSASKNDLGLNYWNKSNHYDRTLNTTIIRYKIRVNGVPDNSHLYFYLSLFKISSKLYTHWGETWSLFPNIQHITQSNHLFFVHVHLLLFLNPVYRITPISFLTAPSLLRISVCYITVNIWIVFGIMPITFASRPLAWLIMISACRKLLNHTLQLSW